MDPLDDAIDRTVRDMTHVAADDRAVARVMSRVRGVDARDASSAPRERWILTPRVAFCGVLALLLMALLSRYSWHQLHRAPEGQRAAVTAPQPPSPQPQQQQPQQPPIASREFPTRVAAAPTTAQATAASRMARRDTLMPASVANGASEASEEQRAQQELTPLESDIRLASITPAPLDEAPAIHLAQLTTTALTVDEIPVPSIELPPVSPEQRK